MAENHLGVNIRCVKVVNNTCETLTDGQNPITPPPPPTPVTFSLLESRARRAISSPQKRGKWELMGRSSANTGGHYERKAITQIKYTAGGGDGAGIWRRNTNYKKAGGPGVIISADADTEEER